MLGRKRNSTDSRKSGKSQVPPPPEPEEEEVDEDLEILEDEDLDEEARDTFPTDWQPPQDAKKVAGVWTDRPFRRQVLPPCVCSLLSFSTW